MDTKQLNEALSKLFVDEGERIVFWNDPEHEFADFMNRLPFLTFDHATVNVIRLDQVGGMEAKIRLERDDPEGCFLLYSPTEEPDYQEDWLLDIRAYSRSFRADRASIILDELGLESQHLREHLAARRTFFDNKERLQKLKNLVASNDTADDLDRKMLAVAVKAEQPEFFTIIRTLFHAFTEVEDEDNIDLGHPPPCWDQIEKFDLAQSFWHFVNNAFGYTEELPSLRNLLIRLLVTDYAHHLKDTVPQSLDNLLLPKAGWSNTVVCLAQWRDSSSKGSSYDLLSAEVARIVNIEHYVYDLEIEAPLDVMTFPDVEKTIVSGLRDRVISTAGTIDAEAIRAIGTRRQDGHWASQNVSASPTVPRQALHAVYNALVAAADFLDLRNQHKDGFDFDTASAMYRAYETELYKFDLLYRHFCADADLAESQSWDVLKALREQIEAVYVNGYMTNQALAWGQFVDPSGTDLLHHWKLDQIPNQHEFYQRYVKTRLDEAENRRVFVVISDAFRYEAAQELAQMLNGTYRFEADLTSQLGVLPSYTALGMASLLPHQVLEYMEDFRTVIEAASAGNPVVCIGVSRGGTLMAMLAATYPSLIQKLVLVSSHAAPSTTYAQRDWIGDVRDLIRQGQKEQALRIMAAVNCPEPGTDHLVEQSVRMRLDMPSDILLKFLDPDPEDDVISLLPHIRVPTLVMHGTADRRVSFTAGQYLAQHIPGAQFYAFQGKGHMAMFTTAVNEFCKVLRGFVRTGSVPETEGSTP